MIDRCNFCLFPISFALLDVLGCWRISQESHWHCHKPRNSAPAVTRNRNEKRQEGKEARRWMVLTADDKSHLLTTGCGIVVPACRHEPGRFSNDDASHRFADALWRKEFNTPDHLRDGQIASRRYSGIYAAGLFADKHESALSRVGNSQNTIRSAACPGY